MLFTLLKSIKSFLGFQGCSHRPQRVRRTILNVEALEDRNCPAGVWEWSSPLFANTDWSNPGGGNWLLNGNAVAAGDYPGMQGSFEDVVVFNNALTSNTVLDVSINAIKSLQVTNWFLHTLTLDNSLTVVGGTGRFELTSSASIVIGDNNTLSLIDLGPAAGPPVNRWTAGTIRGAASSTFEVTGSNLEVSGAPSGLGTTLIVQEQPGQNLGHVILVNMTNNLSLTGEANYIDVRNNGFLELKQQIGVGQQPDTVGGIALAPAHTGTLAIHVASGGELERKGPPAPGGPDNQVSVAGSIHNSGGMVEVSLGAMLNITGQDGTGDSYWQHNSEDARLEIDQSSRITAVGTYRIDTGTVELTAPSGSANLALVGAGLVFGDTNETILTILDSTTGTHGSIIINGNVTLGEQTTTKMNFTGGNNTSNLLSVHDGSLTVNGTLELLSEDALVPTQTLTFFSSDGQGSSIAGLFDQLTSSVGTIIIGYDEMIDPTLYYYRVIIA
jgi:hypothetical protein